MAKSQTLRILLLKEGFTDDDQIISEAKANRIQRLELSATVPFRGRFFY
jgi:hypothetical protein